MIKINALYVIAEMFFGVVAILDALDASNRKRLKAAAFWGINAIILIFGSLMPPFFTGCLVIISVLLVGFGGLGKGSETSFSAESRVETAARFGNKLFIPALLIPFVTLFCTLAVPHIAIGGGPLIPKNDVTLVSLGFATIVALIFGMITLRQPLSVPMTEGRRLLDTIGWAAMLPQMLASLGAVFKAAGVGEIIAAIVTQWIPLDATFIVVATFTVGMALFTMIMGNAFAAFPVMTAGIGLPIIVHRLGGDPAGMAAIGMVSGFCGTLMTPMAANFNIVPAALLELKDENGVIKAQMPTALILLCVNTLLMYFLIFRR